MKIRSRIKKIAYVLPLALLIMMLCSVGVMGFLQWRAPVSNKFTPETAENPTVSETFENNTKTNVAVTVPNTGYSVYVRATVIANWASATGEVHADAPEEAVDYSISYNLSDDGWFRGSDGFFYYAQPVGQSSENLTTDVLIKSCTQITKAPTDKYKFTVDIITQTIQAAGTTDADNVPAVEAAWGVVTVDDTGKLVRK